jgi:hypothetical protein
LQRTAKEVIDQAIAENKSGEWLIYGFATVFALVGLFLLIWAALKGEPIAALAGTLSGTLCWPAVRAVERIRSQNMAIRTLEISLSRADTGKEAAEMLLHLYGELFRDKRKDG